MNGTPDTVVQALRASTKEVERLRRENRRLLSAAREPLAIVGMSCRYPGDVDCPERLWQLLARGDDGISPFPPDRGWDLRSRPDGIGGVHEGGFLRDVADFDADFFKVSPREARTMDPHQRQLLEACWEAIEDAGIDPRELRGSRTGVFAGAMHQDYAPRLQGGDAQRRDAQDDQAGFFVTGGAASVVSGRIAYVLGLEGPAISVDTACSSSLVAIHLACQALRADECSLALAGGVTVLSTPTMFSEFGRQGTLAPNGRCKPFAQAADGISISEGVGVVVLERLSDARRLGHRVLAVVRGSAVNQDGASNGLTAPNGPSQQRVIRAALANAGLEPGQIDAVEAHGTGTTLGDPIEAQALLATYGAERPSERPLWLGSVKSNLGHTQAAAGVAGVIKMAMALRHELLPKTLHVDEPSAQVDWSSGAVSLLTEPRPWRREDEPRRAAVSSFGISGTNAHVILEEAPSQEGARVAGVLSDATVPWVLSGRDGAALAGQARRLLESLERDDGVDPARVAGALALRRPAMDARALVVGADRDELLAGLRALAEGQPAASVVLGSRRRPGPVAFLFPGQGSQWAGMARELIDQSAVFAEAIEGCEQALGEHVEWSLSEVLRDPEGALLDRVDVVQPALFAVMVSLAQLWRACGVEPELVAGHSQGEVAAACVAGGLSLRDGAAVIAARSRALTALAGLGGMVSVACSELQLDRLLEGLDGEISLAAVNGPSALVVSGAPDALETLLRACESAALRARRIPVDYAAHSPQVEAIAQELTTACASIEPRSSQTPFYSAVTGGLLDTAGLNADYWYRNLRETVRFQDVTRALHECGCRTFVEVSPHPVLTAAVQETVEQSSPSADSADEDDSVTIVGSLRRGEGGSRRWLHSLGELWTSGGAADWHAVHGKGDFSDVSLPPYAFQRKRYWLDAVREGGDPAEIGLAAAGHPLLKAAVALAGEGGWLLSGRISLETHPWLADHAVMGAVLVPGTAFLDMALHAGARCACGQVAELVIEAPLVLQEGGAVQLQVTLSEVEPAGGRQLAIYSRPCDGQQPAQGEGEWTRHATGTLVPASQQPAGADAQPPARMSQSEAESPAAWPPQDAEQLSAEELYERLADMGFDYGPAFQNLRRAWRLGDRLFAEVSLGQDGSTEAGEFELDPALLDAALHALAARLASGPGGQVSLPFAWSGVRLHARGARHLRVALTPAGEDRIAIEATDEHGAPVLSVESLLAREMPAEQIRRVGTVAEDWLHRLQWVVQPLAPAGEAVEPCTLLGFDADDPLALSCAGQQFGWLGELLEAEAPAPVVLADCRSGTDAANGVAQAARATAHRALNLIQQWVAEDRFEGSLLVLLTEGAVAAQAGEDVSALADAPLWGLVRSAQLEHPGRLALLDLDAEPDTLAALGSALSEIRAADEHQLALRRGAALAPRLVSGHAGALEPPAGEGPWRLALDGSGTLEGLRLASCPEVGEPLQPGQVRVAVRAAGLSFRDVVAALGMVALRGEWDAIGSEAAGVVVEVGPGVEDLAPGDRVLGVFAGAFGPQALTDRRLLARMPDGWSFAQAAAVPGAFLTAYYGLVELAGVKSGERVLVHAAAGGVGMAAVQIARALGAEVLATASPAKWQALEGMGMPPTHIASSRDGRFEQTFMELSGGHGVDVVLNSLAGDYVDASLRLMAPGGRFVEMGKTDIRDPSAVAERWPGVRYRAFDLIEAGEEGIERMLATLLELFERGELRLPPIRSWDVRHAPEAFRFMAQGRHVGKIVLTLPPAGPGLEAVAFDSPSAAEHTAGPGASGGSVLITGGTGGLGALVAEHLVAEHGVRHLVLASRSGLDAPGAEQLRDRLSELGADVRIVACDVSDREQLRELLASIPPVRPLRAVVHAAGALDDGIIAALTPERIDAAMSAKVDAAWHLHELTREAPLDAFVLFSSLAGVMGGLGQANYAAANSFLDALAAHRRAQGLPGVSMAWGWWEQATGLTGHLEQADLARMRRGGLAPMPSEDGLRLLDLAWSDPDALTVPGRFDRAALRELARADALPAVLRSMADAGPRRSGRQDGGLASSLRGASAQERQAIALRLVRAEAAAVLGHSSPEAIDAKRTFKDLGFDSLLAVELRNRLNAATGMRLAATLVFDHPTPASLAEHLLELIGGGREQPRDGAQEQPRDGAQEQPRAQAPVASLDEDPVAIVGMACRYPGGVRSPQELWSLLAEGVDAIAPFPQDREWDIEDIYDPESLRPGTSYVREGGFVYDAADFDAELFGISPREARAMDPQQRLLLEASWEALEDAGIAPDSLRGSATGVFTGTTSQDYGTRARLTLESFDGFMVTGNSASVLSGRIAYELGLEGPAVTLDTACSSSLVALHMACQALRGGECSLALAGGVAIMSTPVAFLEFSRQRGLAGDGRCKSFADAADGTNWGEGVGVVLLERLSDARRLGHRVLAVVRGSAVNQDGASNGLTAPNGPSQQRVIRQALLNAGLSAEDVDAVEGHGTGTTLGDPIEAQALLATYGRERPPERPLWLGSIKSNIGHTQAAAGIAGVIKMAMALRRGLLPKTLHVDAPSRQVDWSSGAVALLGEPVPWERNGRPRRAGVSSFGVSGTNAHLILEEAPAEQPAAGPEEPVAGGSLLVDGPVPCIVSGAGAAGLRGQAARLAQALAAGAPSELADVGLSLATARATLDRRAVVIAREVDELSAGLSALASGEPAPNLVEGRASGDQSAVFVFPGQGSQWSGMAVELLDSCPLFAERMRECEAALSPFVDWSLEAMLRGEAGDEWLGRMDLAPPVLFATMVSLATVWQACGVRPAAVVGHSQGEIAAACVAGALSLADAARLVARRSQLVVSTGLRGGMASVAAPLDWVRERLERWQGALTVVSLNGPRSIGVGGESEPLEQLVAMCEQEGVRARRVAGVTFPTHTALVEELREQMLSATADLEPTATEIPFHSTVTGTVLDGSELDERYWYRNLREPVQFERTLRGLLEQGHRTFVEMSGHPVLTLAVQETAEPTSVGAIGSLRRSEGGPRRLLASLGEAWVRGVPVEWRALQPAGAERASLPTYAFQRKRYWLAADAPLVSPPTPEATLDRWRYRVTWKRVADPQGTPIGRWPLLVPARLCREEWVATLTAALQSQGAEVLPIAVEEDCALDRTPLAAVLSAALSEADGKQEPAGILSLLALDERPHPEHRAVPRGLAATVALAQALGDSGASARLWLLTRGAVAVGAHERLASPMQAAIWGLGRTLGLEQPQRLAALVDLPAQSEADALARLGAVLVGGGEEDQLAVRGEGVLAARLERAPLQREQGALGWRAQGTAIVTGATGGVGPHVARWLARSGAAHLLLLSRRGPQAPGAAELQAEIEQLGCGVTVLACDVADRESLRGALEAIPQEHPLDVVAHAAGFGTMAPLEQLTAEQMQQTLAAKVAGAHNLHELTRGAELSAFVLFSSMASIAGSAGQADYAAANAYLNALAEQRRGQGLTATSIAWGLWAGEGGGRLAGERLRRRGMHEMAPELAIRGLHEALDREETCLALLDVDWARYYPTYAFARSRPLVEDLQEVRLLGRQPNGEGEEDDAALAAQLAQLEGRERERAVLDLVRARTAAIMGHASSASLDVERSFRELGFDSLMAVELRNALQLATGLQLATTVVFDHPSCVELAEHVLSLIAGDGSAGGDPHAQIDRLELAIAAVQGESERAQLADRLEALARTLAGAQERPADIAQEIEAAASDEEIFGLIERELGSR